MPSLMEALEARRADVLGQAERLREQIAALSEELSRAEERLARLQIARETVEEVLAAPSSPAPDTDAGEGAGGVAVALVKAEGAGRDGDVAGVPGDHRLVRDLGGGDALQRGLPAPGAGNRAAACRGDALDVNPLVS